MAENKTEALEQWGYPSNPGYTYPGGEENLSDTAVNVKYVLFVLIRKWWMIAIITIATLIIGGVYTFAVAKPIYQSSTTVFLYRKADNDATIINDLNIGQQLIKTSIEIVKSDRISKKAVTMIDENIRPSASELSTAIYASAKQDTHIIYITVTNPDPMRAAAYADAVTKAFVEDFDSIINVNGYDKIDFVHIIDTAKVPTAPIKPNKAVNMLAAFAIGFILGCGAIFLSEFFDDTVKTAERVKIITGLEVIGTVMMFED